jgi:hypothetical protein
MCFAGYSEHAEDAKGHEPRVGINLAEKELSRGSKGEEEQRYNTQMLLLPPATDREYTMPYCSTVPEVRTKEIGKDT